MLANAVPTNEQFKNSIAPLIIACVLSLPSGGKSLGTNVEKQPPLGNLRVEKSSSM
jgi:hypothetical protein